jgi:hypothetical protein
VPAAHRRRVPHDSSLDDSAPCVPHSVSVIVPMDSIIFPCQLLQSTRFVFRISNHWNAEGPR